MAYFRLHVKDSKLSAMIDRHFPYHVQDYNMKVEFLTRTEGAFRMSCRNAYDVWQWMVKRGYYHRLCFDYIF